MNRVPDLDAVLREYLAEDGLAAPDYVLDVVQERIGRDVRQRSWPFRRSKIMTHIKLVAALAAALVISIAGIAMFWRPQSTGVGGPGATPSGVIAPSEPAPSTIPRPYAWPQSLEAGEYVTSFIWDLPFELGVAVPRGWESRDIEVVKDPERQAEQGGAGGVAVSFMVVDNVYADPCRAVLRDPPVGPAVDDLIAAIAAIPGIEASGLEPVQFDRRTAGRYLEFVIPETIGCDRSAVHLWHLDEDAIVAQPTGPLGPPIWTAEQPNNRVWVLDVDGVRLVVTAVASTTATPATLAELDDVVDSIRILRPAATPPPVPAP